MTLRPPGTDFPDSSELGQAEGPIRGGLSRVPGVAWNSEPFVECGQRELGERETTGPRGVGRRKGDPFAFPSQRVAVARLWIQFLRELLWRVAVKLGF